MTQQNNNDIENVLQKTKVRKRLRQVHNLNMSSDYLGRLQEEILAKIDESAVRAKKNDRKTIFERDL